LEIRKKNMQTCVFCKIVKGEIDSAKIYEDNEVFAFLDINPLSLGHTLIIPKSHFENIFDINENILQKIIVVTKNISQKIKNNLNADGIRLSQFNGSVAGQEVMHFHLHVIPKYENDELSKNFKSKEVNLEELKKIASKLATDL